jgi:CheY-like chemotaxis protein
MSVRSLRANRLSNYILIMRIATIRVPRVSRRAGMIRRYGRVENGNGPQPMPNLRTRRRVLVVEDDLDSVHSMAVLIKAMGHECQFAINGLAAIEAARTFRPDIVLLDIGLPDFMGDEIARQLKWEPGLEMTRIIAITGLPIDDVGQRARDAGCEEIFAKPLDPAVLEQLLAKPLGV